MIEITNLNHCIGDATILTDINITLPTGGITAVIGPNGAGKSTLINLIAGQAKIQSGAIKIDGKFTTEMNSQSLALKLALVAQHVGVASRLRVADLIGFGRWPHSRGRPTQADHEAVDDAIKMFDLDDLRERFLDELSGGQRQRAFVAMAFAQGTDWLLLDEPLNNLDMYYARALMRELHGLCKSHGKHIVMIVHDVNYASAWADFVVGLKDGKVAISGTPDKTLTQDGIKALFEMDVQIVAGDKAIIQHHR